MSCISQPEVRVMGSGRAVVVGASAALTLASEPRARAETSRAMAVGRVQQVFIVFIGVGDFKVLSF
jgi:hypothetical protein